MIDTDEYEKVFKEYPVSDYWPQMKRIQAHGIRALNEIKRLREEITKLKESDPSAEDGSFSSFELESERIQALEKATGKKYPQILKAAAEEATGWASSLIEDHAESIFEENEDMECLNIDDFWAVVSDAIKCITTQVPQEVSE